MGTGVTAVPVSRPAPAPAPDETDDVDSSTTGAFIVLVLGGVVFALFNAISEPQHAVALYVMFLVASVFTYFLYVLTSYLLQWFGGLGLLLGGWFSFLVGMAAQLVHQLAPQLLTWRLLGVSVGVGFVVSVVVQMAAG